MYNLNMVEANLFHFVREKLTKPSIPESELRENNHVAFVGATYVPTWTIERDATNADATRGHLVLENVKKLLSWGYQVVIIDGGSNPAFIEALQRLTSDDTDLTPRLTVHVDPEGNSLSKAQRKGYEVASTLSGAKVIMTTQPEKPFSYKDMRKFTLPILHNEADMVIPYRKSGLKDYPPEQRYFELAGNVAMSDALRQIGYHWTTKGHDDYLDIYNGTRIVKNDPELLQLLSVNYDESMLDFYSRLPTDEEHTTILKQFLQEAQARGEDIPPYESARSYFSPDKWFAALYGPVAAFAVHGKRILSVDTRYKHPKEQTKQETGNPAFDRKRYQQYMAIVPYFYDYLLYLLKTKQTTKQ